MYSPDTFHRLNEEEIKKLRKKVRVGDCSCEFCDKPAEYVIPVYNPVDSMRKPKVEGVYTTVTLCQDCLDEGKDIQDDIFICEGCGEHFISHHSWDNLTTVVNGQLYCQECASSAIEPVTVETLLNHLDKDDTSDFIRLNSIPKKKPVWTGEYSQYSDFPGFTSPASIAESIRDLDLDSNDVVYPLITQTYQFSVVLSLYK